MRDGAPTAVVGAGIDLMFDLLAIVTRAHLIRGGTYRSVAGEIGAAIDRYYLRLPAIEAQVAKEQAATEAAIAEAIATIEAEQ